MKNMKLLSLLLVLALVVSLLAPGILVLEAGAEEGTGSTSGISVNKTATVNPSGGFDITLEAYATGSKIISSTSKDVPTDIVLVIDQSGSMDYCIVCGEEITKDHNKHDTYNYTATTNISQRTYYIKSGSTYIQVEYCNGKHESEGMFGTRCSGGAGWYPANGKSQNHTAEAKITPKTSSNSNGTQFYNRTRSGSESCSSRLPALKTAVTTFIDSVNTKAKGADGQYGTADDVNHRIAVVGFGTGSYVDPDTPGYPQYENTELFIGATQYGYGSASNYYAAAFQDMNTQSGYNNVIASKNSFAARGATCVDLGIEMANGIFEKNRIEANEKRNRVMIVFTDGAPSSWSSYDSTVANNAISYANTTKTTYKATVYTVGIFAGADATSAGNENGSTEQKANWFMQNVSSNNGTVQNPSYYLSAGDSTSLNNIFQQIADQIESGGSSTTLDSSTVIKDIIAPQFQLPAGATADDITLETYTCTGVDANGDYTWSKNDTALGAAATVDSTTGKVDVTGFDFAANYVGTVTTDGNTAYRGSKLVIKFTVQVRDGFLGGNDVYTNTSAGVYENANATEPVVTFPKPTVNVPIQEISVTAADKNVYLLGSLTAEQIKAGATVRCGNVALDLSAENYGLESWQTEYVNISVSYTDASGNPLTTLSSLKADTTYSITVTISPKTSGSTTTEGTVAKTQSGEARGIINVFKPELTFKDSQVYYGDNAPTDYSGNKTNEVWKHGETLDSAVTMIGTKPTLVLTYTPEAGKIVDNKIASKQDIAVDVAVKIGQTDVGTFTTFHHTDCADKTCGTPNNGKFWLHVNTCQLTITKAAGTNTTIGNDEYFVFNISKDGALYTQASIQGTGSITIYELPVGTYTVEEDSETAWRYTSSMQNGTVTLSGTNPSATVTCTNTKTNDQWLNHFTRVINTYGAANGTKD